MGVGLVDKSIAHSQDTLRKSLISNRYYRFVDSHPQDRLFGYGNRCGEFKAKCHKISQCVPTIMVKLLSLVKNRDMSFFLRIIL